MDRIVKFIVDIFFLSSVMELEIDEDKNSKFYKKSLEGYKKAIKK